MDIGEKIKAIRKEKRVSQAEIAKLLNVTQATYSHLENRGSKLTLEQIEKIAKALDVSLFELLGDDVYIEPNKYETLNKEIEDLKKNADDVLINATSVLDSLFNEFIVYKLQKEFGNDNSREVTKIYEAQLKRLIKQAHSYNDIMLFGGKLFDFKIDMIDNHSNHRNPEADIIEDKINAIFLEFYRIASPLNNIADNPLYRRLFKLISIQFGYIK